MTSRDLIAVDIGNSRLKVGWFKPRAALCSALPEPDAEFALPIVSKPGEFDTDQFRDWCNQYATAQSHFSIASVHRGASKRLLATVDHWARQARRDIAVRSLSIRDVPLVVDVSEPERVGIDRVLSAFAANRMRHRDRPAIIVSLGTAITVDLLKADGVFAGGAILPGVAMSARALAEDTDALPHVNPEQLANPPALGTSTTAAIKSGLYWGTIGAIRELTSQLSRAVTIAPELFLTGGASWLVADQLAEATGVPVCHVPHLVLAGIALVDAEAAHKSGG